MTRETSFVIDSPLGRLRADFTPGDRLSGLAWTDEPPSPPTSDTGRRLAGQLAAYFAGELHDFDIETDLDGTAFRRAVWTAMRAIPYGETRTYGEVAAAIGAAPRAVGGACGRNPIAILVPCHRVVSAGGLGGYFGREGSATKRALLALEGARLPAGQQA